jgi:hypothetical protein
MAWNDTADDPATVQVIMRAVYVLGPLAAWSQHLFTCAAMGRWAFLLIGTLLFPVAVVHGIGTWLAVW